MALPGSSLQTALTAVAVIAVPIVAGALVGIVLRRARGRRLGGVVAAGAFLVAPMTLLPALVLRYPLVGLWDGVLAGFLLGVGVEWTGHATFADRGRVAVAVVSLALSLLVLELACRLFLPVPPGFPTGRGQPHLLLADAMRADTQLHAWDLRSKEIVCALVYGNQYSGILDTSTERDIILPGAFTPRADATRRVLHIGDSMTFGFGVERDQMFTAGLERLEPGTQHINAGIPGTAPDAYLLVLRQWLARHHVDLVVMYVFEGNDVDGLDDRYPCCHWEALLVYGPEGPTMRCPSAGTVDFGKAGTTWLRYNSPPPFLVRALIGYSAAAAYIGAAIVSRMPGMPIGVHQERATALQHLGAILRAARDDLRERHIPFVVVVLPSQNRAQQLATQILQATQRLGVPALDAGDAVSDVMPGGQNIFLGPGDPHYNTTGHAILAQWLHERLGVAAGLRSEP